MESDIAKRSCYKIRWRSLEIAQDFPSVRQLFKRGPVHLFVLCSVWDCIYGHNYLAIM